MDGTITIGTELDTKTFDKEISMLEDKLNDIRATLEMASKDKTLFSTTEIKEMELEAEKLKNKLITLKLKQSDVGKTDFSGIKKSLNSIGGSLQNVTRNVTKWALALFGVRSAYSFIRSSLSVIASQDEQLQVDIDYMKNALAYTIEPIVRAIVDLAKQLMFYVGYVVKALTGKNIFENANKSLKNATGNAKALNKELNKTLASFDEVNVLQNPSSSGASGGTGITTPSFDLSALQDGPMPSWLDWIIKNGDKVTEILLGIGFALIALKAGLDPLKSIGIGLIVAGLYEALKGLLDFIENPTFKNFANILEGIALAVLGVGLAFGLWPVAVAGAVALIIVEIVKHFDEIMGLFDKFREWLDTDFLKKLRELFGPLGDIIYYPIRFGLEFAMSTFESFYGGIKKIVDGIVMIFQGDFLGGIKSIFGGLFDILYAPIKGFLNAVIEIAPKIWGAFKDIGSKIGEVLSSAFNKVINYALDKAEGVLNKPIGSINNLLDTINEVPGINIGKLSKIYLPRLAKGTIASVPGRGIPTPNGIFAEAGREAYLPLSDTQLLEELGSTIGRYITINNYVTNKMDSRTISRELQVTKNQSDFAYNRS